MPRLLPLALALVALSACTRYDPRAGLSEEELVLIDRLERDAQVHVRRTEREADGSLQVVTRQGDAIVRYRIVPDETTGSSLQRVPDHPPLGAGIEPPAQTGAHPERL